MMFCTACGRRVPTAAASEPPVADVALLGQSARVTPTPTSPGRGGWKAIAIAGGAVAAVAAVVLAVVLAVTAPGSPTLPGQPAFDARGSDGQGDIATPTDNCTPETAAAGGVVSTQDDPSELYEAGLPQHFGGNPCWTIEGESGMCSELGLGALASTVMWNPAFDPSDWDTCSYDGWDGAYDSPYGELSELPMDKWGSGRVELDFIGTTEWLDEPVCYLLQNCDYEFPVLATIEGGGPGSVIVEDPVVDSDDITAYLWAVIYSDNMAMKIRLMYYSNGSAPEGTKEEAVTRLMAISEDVAAMMPDIELYIVGGE